MVCCVGLPVVVRCGDLGMSASLSAIFPNCGIQDTLQECSRQGDSVSGHTESEQTKDTAQYVCTHRQVGLPVPGSFLRCSFTDTSELNRYLHVCFC